MDPELERKLDHEYRAEMAAWEAEAAAVGRPLADVLGELVARRASVRIDLLSGFVTGVIVHAASDLVCVRGSRRWDVSLSAIVRLQTGHGPEPGTRWTQAQSFSARLRELRTAALVVTMRCRDGAEIEGVVTEVGPDQVIVGGRDGTVIPLLHMVAVMS